MIIDCHAHVVAPNDLYAYKGGLVGAERCLFGTEKPGSGSAKNPATGRDWDELKSTIEEIDFLTEADRKLIFEDNAKKLYPRL
jgi:4-oxalmesaconate hydratase